MASRRARRDPSPGPAVPSPLADGNEEGGAGTTEVQRRVLDAALGLFAERGYDGVTTAQIASRAGVAEKTLFANFGSKQRLYEATVSPARLRAVFIPEAVRTLVPVLDRPPTDARALVRALYANRVRFAREHPREIKLLAQHLLLNPESVRTMSRLFEARLAPMMRPLIERLVASGALRGDVPLPTLVRMLAAQAAAYIFARVLQPELPGDDESEISLMADVMINGLAPRTRSPVRRRKAARPKR